MSGAAYELLVGYRNVSRALIILAKYQNVYRVPKGRLSWILDAGFEITA